MSSYEAAPATALVATNCAFCSRPLLDAQSIECGVGPICRKKYGHTDKLNEQARQSANKLIYQVAAANDPDVVTVCITQLRMMGATHAAEKLAENVGKVKITQEGATLYVVSPYNAGFVTASRNISGRRWDAANKRTAFPSSSWEQLKAAIAEHYRGLVEVGDTWYAATLEGMADIPVQVTKAPAAAPEYSVPQAAQVSSLQGDTPFADTTELRTLLASTLRHQLEAAGFAKVTDERLVPYNCREEVWERPVAVRSAKPETGHFVRVFTTVVGGQVRTAGTDAIRVVGGRRYWSKKTGAWQLRFFGLAKEKRVNRTGTIEGVVNRTIERCRDAYRVCLADHAAHQAPRAS